MCHRKLTCWGRLVIPSSFPFGQHPSENFHEHSEAPRQAAPSWFIGGWWAKPCTARCPHSFPNPEERFIVTVRIPTPGTSCLYQNVHVYLLCSPHRPAEKLLRETLTFSGRTKSPRCLRAGAPQETGAEFLSRNYRLSREAEGAVVRHPLLLQCLVYRPVR